MRCPLSLRVGEERGAILIQVAVAMIGLLAFGALVMDYGALWAARRQAQNAADAAALSGAISMAFSSPGNPTRARETAAATGHANPVFGMLPTVLSSDITVPYTCPPGSPGAGSQGCVRANVFRNESRDPLPMFLGGLFGRTMQGVQAMAVAEILAANEVECLKPWAVADRWDEFTAGPAPNGIGNIQYPSYDPDWNTNSTYDSASDRYVAPTDTSPGTGFRLYQNGQLCCDYGLVMQLKGDQPYTAMWYQEIDFNTSNSSALYRAAIAGCHTGGIGDTVNVKPGVSHGPTSQGVDDLTQQDPNAMWYYPGSPPASQPWLATWNPNGVSLPSDIDQQCPSGCVYSPDTGVNKSPRIGAIPIITPDDLNSCSNCDVHIKNILGFFVQSVQGNGNNQTVVGRIVTIPGKFNPSSDSVSNEGSFVKTIILVR